MPWSLSEREIGRRNPYRIYVTDIEQREEIGKAHGKFFGDIRPTTTMAEVKQVISPNTLVEIETEAILN
jgi:enamine deaminase RidA (YjgF/YER057c/UK114 family)